MVDPPTPAISSRVHKLVGLAGPRHVHSARRYGPRLTASGTSRESRAAHDVFQTTEEVLVALGAQLSDLIGTDGYRALIGRALQLAAIDYPALVEVRLAQSPPGGLITDRCFALRSIETRQLGEASAAVLSHLLRLIEEFLGPHLVQCARMESWPTLAGP